VERLFHRQKQYDAHRQRLVQEKDAAELAALAEGAPKTPRRTTTPSKFYERSLAWVQRNEARVAAQREAKKNVDLEGCTFKPNTRQP
jgi:hypothetical protein